ncbi:hypothetical protein [Deinococcus sp.]|uniref:hypothetical protein n=1 Tax=Deinococcus sp. TaxID=47478 RepID=UPI003C7A4E8C
MKYQPTDQPKIFGGPSYWKKGGRRTLVQVRQLAHRRMLLRQQIARTLAVHPDVVSLLAEMTAARVRIKVLRELWQVVASSRHHWEGHTAEVAFLQNSHRAHRIAEEKNADNVWDRLFLGQPTDQSIPVSWPNIRRQNLASTLEMQRVKRLLRAALAQLETLELRLDRLCGLYDSEE